MPQSMTGFANQTITVGEWKLSLECKSVNSRFLDITLKLPDIVKGSEQKFRQAITDRLVRGKVELAIRLERDNTQQEDTINHKKLSQLQGALRTIAEVVPNAAAPSTLDILLAPGVWMHDQGDVGELTSSCNKALPVLLDSLVQHRNAEGVRLESLIRTRCESINSIVSGYRSQLPALKAAQKEKVKDRIDAIGASHDEQRLEEELAFLANKSDVAEELDRLDAHINAINDALGGSEPCGRRLDFLMQELNREANTLGSKTTSLTTTNAAVELKVLIEQIREQVQNLE